MLPAAAPGSPTAPTRAAAPLHPRTAPGSPRTGRGRVHCYASRRPAHRLHSRAGPSGTFRGRLADGRSHRARRAWTRACSTKPRCRRTKPPSRPSRALLGSGSRTVATARRIRGSCRSDSPPRDRVTGGRIRTGYDGGSESSPVLLPGAGRRSMHPFADFELAVPKPRPVGDVLPGPDKGHVIVGKVDDRGASHVAWQGKVVEVEVEG